MTSEPINITDLPPQDQADLEALYGEDGGDVPNFHPVLRVWHEVLKPIATERKAKVTPQWASRIIQSYPGLTFAMMALVHELYYSKLQELDDILSHVISSDEDCLTYTTPEEDREHNSIHYKNLLVLWQQAFLAWELEWDCTSEGAAAEVAAIAEVYKMFFGQTGLTAYLDNIKFEFTESDQLILAEALQEMKEAQ